MNKTTFICTSLPFPNEIGFIICFSNRNRSGSEVVIGFDHGYGNIKTANTCFRAGVTAYDKEPYFIIGSLQYNGKWYGISEEHKKFIPDKMTDQDYYILTLAAIARELELAHLTSADIHLAVGLPLTWVSEQKDRFSKYLIQRKDVKFSFDGTAYSIRIVGCDVFPQGFAAVADKLAEFKGTTMLCDIGTEGCKPLVCKSALRTALVELEIRAAHLPMNIMTISNGKPNPQKCYTEKYGTYQCMLSIREQLMRKFGTAIDDDVIDDALRYGKADIDEKYLTVIREVARQYVAGIMRRLREHEYNPELMKLYIVGGGGCLIRNFDEYDPNRVTINDDIRATAKGYEFLANLKLKKANAA